MSPKTQTPTTKSLTRHFHVPSRALMSALFLLSGIGKLSAIKPTQAYMEANAVPGILVYPAAAFEITSGTLLLVDKHVRHIGVLLAGWCLLTAAIFHKDFSDQTETIMFLKNMAMAGGFLVLADRGSWKV